MPSHDGNRPKMASYLGDFETIQRVMDAVFTPVGGMFPARMVEHDSCRTNVGLVSLLVHARY
jgi:hypothetical protein